MTNMLTKVIIPKIKKRKFYIELTLEIWRINYIMKPEIAFQIHILTYATNLH